MEVHYKLVSSSSDFLLFNSFDSVFWAFSFPYPLTFSLFSYQPPTPNRQDYNPIRIPINERPSEPVDRRPEVDRTLLDSISFIPPKSNPVSFISKFESAFKASVSQEVKCVWLKKFVPPCDHSKFDSVFVGELDESYHLFRRLFISAYFRRYYEFRKAKLNYQFEDVSSIVEFVTKKIEIYQSVEGLSCQLATERVFFELPLGITENFLLRNHRLNKEELINYVTFSDYVIEAHYRQVTESAQRSSINDNQQAGAQANNQSAFGQSATRAAGINLSDSRLFLDLGEDQEQSLDEDFEAEFIDSPPVDHLVENPIPPNPSRTRKRGNPASTVTLRKEKSIRQAAKRRN